MGPQVNILRSSVLELFYQKDPDWCESTTYRCTAYNTHAIHVTHASLATHATHATHATQA